MKFSLINLMQGLTLVLLGITSPTASSPLEKRGPVCHEIVIPVSITCDNAVRAISISHSTFPTRSRFHVFNTVLASWLSIFTCRLSCRELTFKS